MQICLLCTVAFYWGGGGCSFSFWSWLLSGLLAPGSLLLASFSPLADLLPPIPPLSCTTRYDTTRQDTVKTPSSRLLPCCTPFSSSPPLLSFVLLSPFLGFFLCLSPVQPPPGPILFLEIRVVQSSRSSSSPLARLLATTPRHHDREPPRRHQQQQQKKINTTNPPPVPIRLQRLPFATVSAPIQYDSLGRQLPFCLHRLCVCVITEHLSHCLHSARCEPVTSVLLGPFVPRLAFSPTKACISRQSPPSECPSGPTTPANFHHHRPLTLVLGPYQAHNASDLTEAPHVLALASHHRVHAWDS